MSVRQFMEWRAYADLEPFDETRADLRAASIVCAILNVNRGRRRPVPLEDCMLRFGSAAGAKAVDPKAARRQVLETFGLLREQQQELKAARSKRRAVAGSTSRKTPSPPSRRVRG